MTQKLGFAAFLRPKVGKKSPEDVIVPKYGPKYGRLIPKNHIHPFLDYIVNSPLNLSIFGVLVGGL